MKRGGIAMLFTVGTVLVLAGSAQQTKPTRSSEYPSATVREEQKITVGGVSETWQLQWAAAPVAYCEAADPNWSICPCMGFAFGEAGDLSLVRIRQGNEIDRLHLTPFFTEGKAVVQQWAPDPDKDLKDHPGESFPTLVSQRTTVQVMHLRDYDHDRHANEFYLQTETIACGKNAGVLIGLSKSNPRLHAIGKASSPDEPLHLQKREWEALRNSGGPVDVLDWACGDHGAQTETRLRLHWTAKGVEGIRRQFACTPDFKAARLLHEEPL